MSGGTISTAVICVILAVICIFSVKKYRKKLTSGCCGAGGEGTVKKRTSIGSKQSPLSVHKNPEN